MQGERGELCHGAAPLPFFVKNTFSLLTYKKSITLFTYYTYTRMAHVETFVIPNDAYDAFLNGNSRTVEYLPNKIPSIGSSVCLRPYDTSNLIDAFTRMEGKVVAIDELPRKRGQLRRYLFTINVQLIMF